MIALDYTIDLTLKRIHGDKEIETKISRKDMKNLLIVCTKNAHFTFGNNIYQQKDGVAMGSPLGPALAGISMVHFYGTDFLLMRCNGKFETTVFRKETNKDIYLYWRSFSPMTWKKSYIKDIN